MSENIIVALISFTGTIIAAFIGAFAASRNAQKNTSSGKANIPGYSYSSYYGLILGSIGGILYLLSPFLVWGASAKITLSGNRSMTIETGIPQHLSDKSIVGLRADLVVVVLGIIVLSAFLLYWVRNLHQSTWATLVLGLFANSGYIFFLNPSSGMFSFLREGAGVFLAGTYATIIASVILRRT